MAPVSPVTVLGAKGIITVPFKSQANAALAQQLANQISAAITNETLYPGDYNSTSLPALPQFFEGPRFGEQVSGDNEPSSELNEIQNPAGYPVIINNNADAVTIAGAPWQVLPYAIIS